MIEAAADAMISEAVSILDLPPLRGNPFDHRPIEPSRAQDLVARDSLMIRLREHIISESPRNILLVGESGSGRTSMVNALSHFGISAQTRPKAPGVYVNEAKIGALGLRIKNGKSYHGLSLNVDMDLAPFSKINPCGFENLEVTQVSDHIEKSKFLMRDCSEILSKKLLGELGYDVR